MFLLQEKCNNFLAPLLPCPSESPAQSPRVARPTGCRRASPPQGSGLAVCSVSPSGQTHPRRLCRRLGRANVAKVKVWIVASSGPWCKNPTPMPLTSTCTLSICLWQLQCETAAELQKNPANYIQCKFQTGSLSDSLVFQGPLITHSSLLQ